MSTANDFDETAEICERVFNGLRTGLAPELGDCLPALQKPDVLAARAMPL